MHGRKQQQRDAEAAEPEDVRQARIAKFSKLRNLLQVALNCRRVGDVSNNALDLSAKLLTINPSIVTLWNLRRDALTELKEMDDVERVKELV